MEDLEREVALEIDVDRLRIFVAAFRAAAAERLLRRANVDVSRPSFRGAELLDAENEIARDAGVIAGRKFVDADGPRLPLHDDLAATQTRHVRRAAEVERMKAERDQPGARERAEILAGP